METENKITFIFSPRNWGSLQFSTIGVHTQTDGYWLANGCFFVGGTLVVCSVTETAILNILDKFTLYY